MDAKQRNSLTKPASEAMFTVINSSIKYLELTRVSSISHNALQIFMFYSYGSGPCSFPVER